MKKKDVITKEDLELYYNQCRKIKFKTINPSNKKELIMSLIDPRTVNNDTVFTKGGYHCDANRYRSLDDLIKVFKYYYPEDTVESIIKFIKSEEEGVSFRTGFSFRYCPTIKKDNFSGIIGYNRSFSDPNNSDRNFSKQGFINCNVKYKDFF